MRKSITLLAIAILVIDVLVLGISFFQQAGKLTLAGANITVLEGQVSALTEEAAALQQDVSNLQTSINESAAKSTTLQGALTESQANTTALQDALNQVNAGVISAQAGNNLPPPAPAFDPAAPAAFVVSDLKINETLIQPWDIGTVTVMVTNTGGQTGNYTVVLTLNGQIWATKSVTVAPGKSEYAIFGVQPNKEVHAILSVGNMTVEADWLTH